MSLVQYTAINRGSLISGHVEGTEYSFDLPFASKTTEIKRQGVPAVSLSGKRFYTGHRVETSISLTTAPLHIASQSAINESVEEMFMSVASGEMFEIDFGSGYEQYVIDGSLSKSIVDNFYNQFSFKAVKV
jgi:hypothetical protein